MAPGQGSSKWPCFKAAFEEARIVIAGEFFKVSVGGSLLCGVGPSSEQTEIPSQEVAAAQGRGGDAEADIGPERDMVMLVEPLEEEHGDADNAAENRSQEQAY